MSQFEMPKYPYHGPAAHTSAGSNFPLTRVVIHATVSPCQAGQARKTAAYFQQESSGGSAHYIVDPEEIVRSVKDDVIAWHAPPNQGSIGIEMCDYPKQTSMEQWKNGHARTRKNPLRWLESNHRRMLVNTARLTAQLCVAYDIPAKFRSPADLRNGKKGITTHANVSRAFEQSTHWDPGLWPQSLFMVLVRRNVRRIRRNHR